MFFTEEQVIVVWRLDLGDGEASVKTQALLFWLFYRDN